MAGAHFTFKVRDNGVGISPDFLDKIYESFERESESIVNGVQGSGLGLTITKSIVDAMNGQITVQSRLHKGSLFIVNLDFPVLLEQPNEEDAELLSEIDADKTLEQIKEETNRKEEIAKRLAGKKVLVVDDLEINRRLLIKNLELLNMTYEEADCARVAIDKIESRPDNTYDIVLMDIHMTGMDGYEATRVIRSMRSPAKANIPVLAVTADAFVEDRKKAEQAGMNGFITKPIDREKLIENLGDWIN